MPAYFAYKLPRADLYRKNHPKVGCFIKSSLAKDNPFLIVVGGLLNKVWLVTALHNNFANVILSIIYNHKVQLKIVGSINVRIFCKPLDSKGKYLHLFDTTAH